MPYSRKHFRIDSISGRTIHPDGSIVPFEVTGTKLRYSREYMRRSAEIGPERIGDLRKFEGLIGADESASVVLKKVP